MRRALALILALVMTMALVSCGGDKTTGSTPGTPDKSTTTPGTPDKSTTTPGTSEKPSDPKPTEPEKPAEPKILKLAVDDSASNAHPIISSTGSDGGIQGKICEQLYGTIPVNGKGSLVPVLAAGDPVDVNGDGTVWNIAISPDAKWENGESMNADTFIYSFQKFLDPKLLFASGATFATNYIEILNGKAYVTQAATGVPVAWEEVGIKKVDEMTIQIITAAPYTVDLVKRHFSQSYTTPFYQPLFDQCLSADGTTTTYGSSLDKLISCGPFKLTNWTVGAIREYVKNEYYVRADLIKLDGVTETVVKDAGTQMQMFEAGELDHMPLTAAGLEKYGDDPRVAAITSSYTRMIDICDSNTEKPILANMNFKKALFYGTDRVTLCKVSGDSPATGFVNPMFIAYTDGTSFRQLAKEAGYEPANYGYDPELAKQYFDKAMQEEGLTTLELSMLYSASVPDQVCIAEFVQESWSKLFGADRFKLTLNPQPSKTALTIKKSHKTNPNAYELTVADWGVSAAQYDPIKSLYVYTSTYASTNAPYHNDTLDALIAEAYLPENRNNLELRAANALKAEQSMLEEVTAIPIMYNSYYEIVSSRVLLPLGKYDSSLGWGLLYCDIAQ
ncbi:MAG: hypothetical protein E7445_09770 [Ruminococcaceae bacterium]|nr:hypothetical protein [Oscillospiraceae bacterium]